MTTPLSSARVLIDQKTMAVWFGTTADQFDQICQGTTPVPPTVALGLAQTVTEGTILGQGNWIFIETGASEATLIVADGTTTEAPADGVIQQVTVT
jgi:hypothetical protein